jgi:hypothetical protein
MNQSRPQTRHSRDHKQAQERPQSRFIHVHEQSAFASSPRQQARQQPVRIHGKGTVSTIRDLSKATDMDTPQTDRDCELAFAKTSLLTGSSREPESAANCPCHRLAVAILPTIRFPVHIHIMSNHVRI